MKAILMSYQPQEAYKILNGDKTMDVRKKFPKDYRGWVYIYCTKGKTELYSTYKGYVLTDFGLGEYYKTRCLLNGKVVGRFYCDNVEGIDWGHGCYYSYSYVEEDILKKSCLSFDNLARYLKGKIGYAIHITNLQNLQTFDTPKELREFGITKAPQSWQYIEVE